MQKKTEQVLIFPSFDDSGSIIGLLVEKEYMKKNAIIAKSIKNGLVYTGPFFIWIKKCKRICRPVKRPA